MSTNANPTDTARHTIDLRLDAIDRALLGLLPRHDRLELVAQIETKLKESTANPEAALDLPHQPGNIESELSGPTTHSPHLRDPRFFPRRRPRSRVAVSSGVLGIVAMALLATLPFIYLLTSMLNMDGSFAGFFLCGQLAAVALCGLLAIVLGIAGLVVLSRHGERLVGHGWAITGLCTGPLPLFAGGLVALAIGYELWGSVTVTPAYSTVSVSPPSPPVAASPYDRAVPECYPVPAAPVMSSPTVLPQTTISPNFEPNYSASPTPVSTAERSSVPPSVPPTPDIQPPAEAPPAAPPWPVP